MLGIIGGTGLYRLNQISGVERVQLDTPFGSPSGPILLGRMGSTQAAFLARHGESHSILPHEINFRANIWALKSLGVRQLVSVSAVGSLAAEIEPGHFAIPDQYLDFTKGKREQSFFGNGLVAHISSAKPVCPNLSSTLFNLGSKSCPSDSMRKFHKNATYACIEGPRLGTRAESVFLGSNGAHIVGMTNVPEAFLAREAQICYATIAVVMDYDSLQDDPGQHVSLEKVFAQYKESISNVQRLISELTSSGTFENHDCECRHSLSSAILTPEEKWNDKHRAILKVLRE